MKVDWVVVGAGLTGATFAERVAAELGQSVLVVEQRDHIGGNAWDEHNARGILEHKYGPHIFHTNSKNVWDYLSRFTDWRPYMHRVLGSIDGRLVPLPFNLTSIERLFPAATASKLVGKLTNAYGFGSRVPILKLQKADDSELQFLAEYVYKKVFEGYTLKQWGLAPEELAPSVTARVPIVVSYDDRYFPDAYQAMPTSGYGAMVRRMLLNKNIRLILNTRWQDIASQVSFQRIIYTGPIDEYFQWRHGPLPYRSLRFDVKTIDQQRYQDAAVINYPNEYDFTRVTEQKWITGQQHPQTTIIAEYPIPHVAGSTVPYYPIPTEPNQSQYRLYSADAEQVSASVTFAGRLGDYTYYNMDQAVARALKLFREVGRA
jgi:UDP-galactopyranose mutase